MDEDENTATTTQEVSVPYRGATFLNAFSMVSPYGVMPRFRPLSGSYISQSGKIDRKYMAHFSFRPLSGSYISQ